jgi:hypothetical protein
MKNKNTDNSKLMQKSIECEKLRDINNVYIRLMDEYRIENETIKSDNRVLIKALSLLRKDNRILRQANKEHQNTY